MESVRARRWPNRSIDQYGLTRRDPVSSPWGTPRGRFPLFAYNLKFHIYRGRNRCPDPCKRRDGDERETGTGPTRPVLCARTRTEAVKTAGTKVHHCRDVPMRRQDTDAEGQPSRSQARRLTILCSRSYGRVLRGLLSLYRFCAVLCLCSVKSLLISPEINRLFVLQEERPYGRMGKPV